VFFVYVCSAGVVRFSALVVSAVIHPVLFAG
jgi:hypothetical protein